MTVNILGTEYEILEVPECEARDNPKIAGFNGYTEPYTKKLMYVKFGFDPERVDSIHEHEQKTVRHEIVHAFLIESGLDACSDWARNEEIVDWIARQFPKMMTAMIAAGALEPPKQEAQCTQ